MGGGAIDIHNGRGLRGGRVGERESTKQWVIQRLPIKPSGAPLPGSTATGTSTPCGGQVVVVDRKGCMDTHGNVMGMSVSSDTPLYLG